MKKERISLNDITGNITSMFSTVAKNKGIRLESVICRNDVCIQGDKPSVDDALINVLDNALKYTHEGGSVIMKVGETSNEAVIEVTDTGMGIPEDKIENIFQRFYRVDASRSRERQGKMNSHTGYGLGLSIVKEIIENHNGRMDVQSKETKGTVFSLYFPKFSDSIPSSS